MTREQVRDRLQELLTRGRNTLPRGTFTDLALLSGLPVETVRRIALDLSKGAYFVQTQPRRLCLKCGKPLRGEGRGVRRTSGFHRACYDYA